MRWHVTLFACEPWYISLSAHQQGSLVLRADLVTCGCLLLKKGERRWAHTSGRWSWSYYLLWGRLPSPWPVMGTGGPTGDCVEELLEGAIADSTADALEETSAIEDSPDDWMGVFVGEALHTEGCTEEAFSISTGRMLAVGSTSMSLRFGWLPPRPSWCPNPISR
jgi:hypothetical protein